MCDVTRDGATQLEDLISGLWVLCCALPLVSSLCKQFSSFTSTECEKDSCHTHNNGTFEAFNRTKKRDFKEMPYAASMESDDFVGKYHLCSVWAQAHLVEH